MGAWSVSGPGAGEFLPPAPPGGSSAAAHAAPSFRRAGLLVAAIVTVVALVGVGLATTVFSSSDYPSRWDPRLGDLPATVARLRGLQFDHPVPVRYESARRFVKERALGTVGAERGAARRASARATESLRAIGLVSGKVDLFAASKAARDNRVLAFYDPDAKEVVIRGGTKFLDVPHRVVLAHELTHVLQDQHFDLNRLQDSVRRAPGQSPEALRAVIEGDANRIEDKYLVGPVADRPHRLPDLGAQGCEERGPSHRRRARGARACSRARPTRSGRSVLQVVAADGGNGAVDRVFEHGVFTQELFVEPTASLTEPAPAPIAAPKAAPGEKADRERRPAGRVRPLPAARVAGRRRATRSRPRRSGRAGAVRQCAPTAGPASGASSTHRPPPGHESSSATLRRWSAALPAGMATVRRVGSRVVAAVV